MAEANEPMPTPPADFIFLVESLIVQAQIHLGLLFGGDDEKPETNLPLARHAIDMLAMLQQKTKGNLDLQEQRLLENGLTELRFRYVQVADQPHEKAEALNGQTQEKTEEKEEAPRIILSEGGKGTKSI